MINHGNAPRSVKASFDHIYDCPDPESYFRELRPLEYRAPQSALSVFQACFDALRQLRGRRQLTVLDLCCSYGINAALINYQLDLDDLYNYFTDARRSALPLVQRLTADQDFFARYRVATDQCHQVIGIDVARNALAYARLAGLMPQSFAINLEDSSTPIGPDLARTLAEVDIIIVTGGLSYIGATAFRRLLATITPYRTPWIACFPLRTADFRQSKAAFSHFELRTERAIDASFRQRRFLDQAEQNRFMQRLRQLALDSNGKEADGFLHAALYLARPRADAIQFPIKQLIQASL